MTPLPTLPKASLDMGYGGVDRIRFEAADSSCWWNGFPICIDAALADVYVPSPLAYSSRQLSSYQTPSGIGIFTIPDANWPHIFINDYVEALGAGYRPVANYRFDTQGGGTSVGSVTITNSNPAANCDGSFPGPIVGHFESGDVDIGACPDCSVGGTDPGEFMVAVTNFSPITSGVRIGNGFLTLTWELQATPIFYQPNQQFKIRYEPCDPDAGLLIDLPTDNCGALTMTYQDVVDEVNALGIDIVASVIGAHGADVARPDPNCPAPDYCCDMTGAECSGTAHP